jgi:hypothetical protein
LLEACDGGAEDEVLRGNDLSDSGIELGFERFVLWFEVEEGDSDWFGHMSVG